MLPRLGVSLVGIVLATTSAIAARPVLADEATFGAGEILVHYATSGEDLATPAFAEQVATTARDALTELVALGFKRPLSDGVLGGDGRIDLYLENLQAADGNASIDRCEGTACVGYAIAENDYAGYSYGSVTEAIGSVVPHELFHLIQYAYAMDQAATWTEGTAVWAVEHLYGADNSDFERFLPSFLGKTFRPFERPSTGFGDAYAYGAALWPRFLEETFDAQLVREAWDACATSDFIDALDTGLAARGSSFVDAWILFTRWNALTGSTAAGSYAAASMMPAAPREAAITTAGDVYVEGYSARYVPVAITEPGELVVSPTAGITVAAWVVPFDAPLADGRELDGDAARLAISLAPGSYLLVVTGLSPSTITTAVHVSVGPEASDGGCASAPGASLLVGLLLVAMLTRRKRALALVVAFPLVAHAQADEEIIVVTGTKSETPRAASPVTTEVIDRQRIEESGAQTVSEALSLRPGIWIDRNVSGDPGVSLQGLSPQYTLILVDGARQIGRTDGTLDLDRFGLEDIERIEIVRGPASVLYGSDALGGVINLITRTPKSGVAADALVRIDSRFGYEARGRVAGGTKTWKAALTGTYREADAIRIGNDGTALGTSIDAYEDAHATGHVQYAPDDKWRIEGTADYVQRDLRGIDAMATGAIFDRRNLVESASLATSATYAGDATAFRAEANGSFYRDQYLSDQRMSTAEDQYQVTDENLAEARAQIAHQRGRHRGTVGAELLREALKSPRLSDLDYHDRYRAAVFAQDEWKLGADYQVLIVPAARVDVDSQFGTNATPRLAARWQVADGATVRGSVGMGYRAPSFKELLLLFANPGVGYVVEGNPDLEPEKSISGQLGAEYQATKWLWIGGDSYLNQLRDMILAVTKTDDGTGMLRFSYDNIGRARTMGGEVYAIASYGSAGLELGYALNLTRDLESDRVLEGLPRHRLTATLRWREKADRLDAFLAAVVSGGRPYYLDATGDATYTDARVEVRARVAKRFASGFGAFLGIDNVLDAGDDNLDRLAPRTLYSGVELHL